MVETVAPLASEVLVAVSSTSRREQLSPDLDRPVTFVIDEAVRWGAGPGAAIASVRERVPDGPLLFVPGDLPWMETSALGRFVARASTVGAPVAVPCWSSGETEHLIQWHRNSSTVRAVPWRSPHSLPSRRASEFLRAVPRTLLVPVAALTDRPRSFSHVTFESDLRRPLARGIASRRSNRRLIEGTPKRWYRVAQVSLARGDSARAAAAFSHESVWYDRAGLPRLARHALQDAIGTQPKR